MTADANTGKVTPEKVTIYDIAKHAGVAPSTVSRALNRPDRVSFATAAKVREAAEELGYKRDLATPTTPGHPHTGNLGIVVADITNPFFLEIIRGVEHAARVAQFQLFVTDIDEVSERSHTAAEALISHVDALLLASARLSNADATKLARRVPTVSINRPLAGVPSVLVDNYEGAIKAVRHLEEQGVRSITYIAGPDGSWADGARLRGLLDATGLSDANSPGTCTYTRTGSLPAEDAKRFSRITVNQLRASAPTTVGGRRAFSAWAHSPTDAVMCFNDLVAIGFMQQARREGVHVPEDVAVIGFDNTEVTTISQPTLSTVAGPLRTVGRIAAATAMALATGQRGPMTKPRVLPTQLIVRESSWRKA